jgi:HK97 family phage major capsid protein
VDRINELKQAALEARETVRQAERAHAGAQDKHDDFKSKYGLVLQRQARGAAVDAGELDRLASETDSAAVSVQSARRAVERAKEQLAAAERDRDAEQARLDAEDAELMRNPSGRVPGTRRASVSTSSAAGALGVGSALSALPMPSQARAAIAKLYGGASASAEDRAESWRGAVAAALGGNPMHPAVLAATATEGSNPDGGFSVVPEVVAAIFERAAEESVFIRIGAAVVPMLSDERIVPALDDDDETDDAEATLVAEWKGEATEADAQLVKLRQAKLKAHKLLVLAAASNELGEDAPHYIMALEAAIARAIGKKFDKAILSGTGVGMPLGILASAATITVSAEAEQAASTFVFENVASMWARLSPGSHERSWWLMHPTVLPKALTMSLAIGTGGTQPKGVFEPGGPTGYQLLGRPVLVTSRVKPLGQKGDVILLDPTQIAVGIRRGLSIERSPFPFFSSDRLAIRGRFRGDAAPMWDAARTLADSGGTVSPYVVLEARA